MRVVFFADRPFGYRKFLTAHFETTLERFQPDRIRMKPLYALNGRATLSAKPIPVWLMLL
jgi:hypothetical protein